MEMARVPIRVLEPESPLAEVHFASDAGVHHPLQRAVDRGSADAVIFVPDEFDQIVGAQVSFLAQEHIDDEVAFAGALSARGPEPIEIEGGRCHVGSERLKSARAG